jgi:glycyl-tRNA synthetase beta chain
MSTQNLLVELFVEELPPKALRQLGESFARGIAEQLKAQGLIQAAVAVTPGQSLASDAPSGSFRAFASPRRLAVQVAGVQAKANDQALQKKLMPVSVGLNAQGEATPALLKKLAGFGLGPEALPSLKRAMDGKAQALFVDSVQPGVTLAQGLQHALHHALNALPIPKVMSYPLFDGCGLPGWDRVHFVRPAHGLVALHGSDVVPVSVLGLQAGRHTHGHRFEAEVDAIALAHADDYAEVLRAQGAVVACFDERRAEIERQLSAAADRIGHGVRAIDDAALLDEVTALVERPNVLACGFEPEFLAVPQECLILTMKANQKYFPLLDQQGKLTHQFLVVSNISPADPSAVIQGNERVVRPRLADAKFFFDQDRKKTLASRVEGLSKVVYHNQLGTQGQRSERVRAIAHAIVNQLRQAQVPFTVEAKDEFEVLDSKVQEAARLAKTDLLTDMVGEFPELQGIMGGYYARHEGLRDGVAIAIEDHYKPRFAGDALPRNHTGTLLALADKLETLVGLFGIGQLPTGVKDPFALRRHALGVIRLLVENKLDLRLNELIAQAAQAFGQLLSHDLAPLSEFVFDRLAGSLREQGYSAQEVDAVLALRVQCLADIPARLSAVRAFADLPEAAALAAANKRIGNILKKAEGACAEVNVALLQDAAECDLHARMGPVVAQADRLFECGDYQGSLRALAALRDPVDAFFEHVMVNADDAALRANRLGLLATLHAAMNRVADLSRLSA